MSPQELQESLMARAAGGNEDVQVCCASAPAAAGAGAVLRPLLWPKPPPVARAMPNPLVALPRSFHAVCGRA